MKKDVEWFKTFIQDPRKVLKVLAFGVGGIVVLAILLVTVQGTSTSLRKAFNNDVYEESYSGGYAVSDYDASYAPSGYGGGGEAMLSIRNIAPIDPPLSPSPTGNTAEDYEVTSYNASIETRSLEDDCRTISTLKDRSYVIFENAHEYDQGCSYSFKVEREYVGGVLDVIEGLNPRDLSENTYTIKRQIDDFTSERDILTAKLATIEATLADALKAYDDITALATRTDNAESLAKIIDSKVNVIERLTRERLAITSELERLSRAKADALDRLVYVYFSVNVYENKMFDGEAFKDSWKGAFQNALLDLNKVLQGLTLYLVIILITAVQYGFYLFLLLVALKYGYRFAKDFWKK